ncbi:MAG: discoidin domain-containing protein, partial [Candidatus Acidiferrales bacterium]
MRFREFKMRDGLCAAVMLAAVAIPAGAQTVRIDATPAHAVNTFSPLYALGSTVDRVPSNMTDTFFEPDQLKQILSAGWGQISYRQNTELFIQDWHWNPKGTWSDPSGKGYFVGDATPTSEPIRHSYGYALPHRGFTRNGGTEDDGYSRLNDGDTKSYWKSNPYLTSAFTGEDDTLHPQWIVIDLEAKKSVNTMRLNWAEPYARVYQVQYWVGTGDAMDEQASGDWKTFPGGAIHDGKGGNVMLKLADAPIELRWLRVLMTQSSNTCDTHGSADKRNCVGYAINEVYLGATDASGKFTDFVRHTKGQDQTYTLCSSVDPWHQASDLLTAPNQMWSGDQPGFDLFYTSGITRGMPAIVPIALVYGVPEDSAAQIAYIEKRGYPIARVEMGEEADGQYMVPEDYASLYIQWATALHRVDPNLKLGGPAFQGVAEDIKTWRDANGNDSWFGRFLNYLKAHGRLSDFTFMSFEHYPYDGCEDTETNAHGGEASVEVFGALWLADSFGGFLTAGGQGTYYYHDLPYSPAHPNCKNSWGTYHMFMIDKDFKIRQKVSQYFAAEMLTEEWAQPVDQAHTLFRATADLKDADGHVLVTAYPLKRPDGQWAVLLVNKDYDHSHAVKIVFHDEASGADQAFAGDLTRITFGKEQYTWHPARKEGYADPDGPAARSTEPGSATATY